MVYGCHPDPLSHGKSRTWSDIIVHAVRQVVHIRPSVCTDISNNNTTHDHHSTVRFTHYFSRSVAGGGHVQSVAVDRQIGNDGNCEPTLSCVFNQCMSCVPWSVLTAWRFLTECNSIDSPWTTFTKSSLTCVVYVDGIDKLNTIIKELLADDWQIFTPFPRLPGRRKCCLASCDLFSWARVGWSAIR